MHLEKIHKNLHYILFTDFSKNYLFEFNYLQQQNSPIILVHII